MEGQDVNYLFDFAVYSDTRINNILPMKNYCGEFGFYILNLDHDTDIGTHWVALVHCLNNNYKDTSFYFDSFGFQPPQEFIDKQSGTIFYSNVQLQKYSREDNNCGIWCLIFLKLFTEIKKPSKNDFNKIINDMKTIEIIWK